MYTSHIFITIKTYPSCEFLVVCGQLRVGWVYRAGAGWKWAGAGKISQIPAGSGRNSFKFCRCRQKISTRAGL